MPYTELLETAARIGIDEERFWRMTPAEFERRAIAVMERRSAQAELERNRQDTDLRRTAWVVATLMNFAGKQLPRGKRVSVDDLIRKNRTPADLARARSELIRRHRLTQRFDIIDTHAR